MNLSRQSGGFRDQTASITSERSEFVRLEIEHILRLEKGKISGDKTSALTEDRVRCRACRFDRCVDVGMNPLAITSIPVPGKYKGWQLNTQCQTKCQLNEKLAF